MAILIDQNTRILVQGITGNVGAFQTILMQEYGSKIVAGVTPGKGGAECQRHSSLQSCHRCGAEASN